MKPAHFETAPLSPRPTCTKQRERKERDGCRRHDIGDVERRMLKPCADLIEKLIRHDQRTGFTYGNKPRFEMREKPLLYHFSSSFLPENQNRSEGRSCGSLCCPGRKRLRFPARFAKEPDQHSSTISLWIARYRPTSVMKPRAMNSKL